MNIKKTADLVINFTINRLAEILGIIIFISGGLLLIALASYSPEDPNFIFPENTEIKNLLGFQGSFVSDLFFQSVGLIAYLLSFTLIITGINIFTKKEFFLIIENIFFGILYSVFGTLFLAFFYSKDFTLYINGNGGFVGNYLNQTFLNSLIQINENIFYYILILLVLFLFLISINFRPKNFYNNIKKIISFFNKSKNKNYTDKSEIINEYIPQDEIKNLIQEDLPFIKAENKTENKIKFKLPGVNLLKEPSKKERENSSKNLNHDSGFLEKTGAKLGQLVRLREIGSGADGNELALRAFESALAIQDLNGAVRAAGRWAGPDLPSLKNWIGLAQSRQSLDRVVSALVADRLAGALSVQ